MEKLRLIEPKFEDTRRTFRVTFYNSDKEEVKRK